MVKFQFRVTFYWNKNSSYFRLEFGLLDIQSFQFFSNATSQSPIETSFFECKFKISGKFGISNTIVLQQMFGFGIVNMVNLKRFGYVSSLEIVKKIYIRKKILGKKHKTD